MRPEGWQAMVLLAVLVMIAEGPAVSDGGAFLLAVR